MPNTRNVNLDVRAWASNDPGWVNVNASNGSPYSYSYSGGDDGRGGATFKKSGGPGNVNVSLVADRRYQIDQVIFSGDGAGDFSYTPGPRTIVISDTVKDAETVKYSVVIKDTTVNCTVTCDPQIINKAD